MSNKAVSLDEFIAGYPLWGSWDIAYTDPTHLAQGSYMKLGSVAIGYDESTARKYSVLPFVFQTSLDEGLQSHFQESEGGHEQAANAKDIIEQQIAESLVRSGLLRPTLRLMQDHSILVEFQAVLRALSQYHYLILVVDTSALRRGAVTFLLKALPHMSIWTVVPVFVMAEVQRAVSELTKYFRERKAKQGKPHWDALKKRPQVSCISRELNYLRQWRPVELLAAPLELLERPNVDRFIIESVKNLKRERGLHQGVYLLTADKDMASLATLENVNSLHMGIPPLPDQVSSVRFDSWNPSLILSPVHYLLWDLAQVFSTIRLHNTLLDRTYEICYYSEAREGFFAHDVMDIRES